MALSGQFKSPDGSASSEAHHKKQEDYSQEGGPTPYYGGYRGGPYWGAAYQGYAYEPEYSYDSYAYVPDDGYVAYSYGPRLRTYA